jgi:hypothetical protein
MVSMAIASREAWSSPRTTWTSHHDLLAYLRSTVQVLIRAAENHLDSSLVQSQVAGALRNLSLSDEVAEQIAISGGIEALVKAAEEHRANSKVQAGVAGALRNLSVNDGNARTLTLTLI